jgi:hypothetical protein
MTDHQPLIDRLEALVDSNNRPDWKDVVRRAKARENAADTVRARRAARSYLAKRLVPAFVLAAAALAIGLIAPWQHGRSFTERAVAERALIAIGNGPVLHAVLRRETPWGYIDLASGKERPMADIQEIWFDNQRHFEHMKMSIEGDREGKFTREILHTPTGMWASYDIDPGRPHAPTIDPALGEFFDGYRSALASKKARVTGSGTVDGREVTWIEFAGKSGCYYYACSQRVAVDKLSSLPLQIAWLREGKVTDSIGIDSIETLPAGSGDFSRPKRIPENQHFFVGRQTTPIGLSAASEELPNALWLGESISGLQLSSVSRSELTTRETAEPGSAESIGTAIELHYGNGSPSSMWSKPPATNGEPSKGNVVLQEQSDPDYWFWPFPAAPAGSMLTNNRNDGYLVKDGTYVAIHASNPELVLAAAHALKAIDGASSQVAP